MKTLSNTTNNSVAVDFFNVSEINHFASIAGFPYRKASASNVADGNRIKVLVAKLNEWVANSLTDDYAAYFDNTWQWSGTFKSYLWIRIYKKNALINIPLPKVYYVFGINDASQLYMEMNCQRSNYANGSNVPLLSNQISSFDKYLHESDYSPKNIDAGELTFYDWNRLLKESKEFLQIHDTIYDELLNVVDPEGSDEQINSGLELMTKPNTIRSKIPVSPSFKGVDIDYEGVARTSKYLGDAGEQIVIEHEQNKLRNLEFFDLIDQVIKAKDGEGYDIHSFDHNRRPIYIEVKTTTGRENEPFYLTHNELKFAEKHKENYFIFRVYGFRPNPHRNGKVFIWTWEDLTNAVKTPLQYEISKK